MKADRSITIGLCDFNALFAYEVHKAEKSIRPDVKNLKGQMSRSFAAQTPSFLDGSCADCMQLSAPAPRRACEP